MPRQTALELEPDRVQPSDRAVDASITDLHRLDDIAVRENFLDSHWRPELDDSPNNGHRIASVDDNENDGLKDDDESIPEEDDDESIPEEDDDESIPEEDEFGAMGDYSETDSGSDAGNPDWFHTHDKSEYNLAGSNSDDTSTSSSAFTGKDMEEIESERRNMAYKKLNKSDVDVDGKLENNGEVRGKFLNESANNASSWAGIEYESESTGMESDSLLDSGADGQANEKQTVLPELFENEALRTGITERIEEGETRVQNQVDPNQEGADISGVCQTGHSEEERDKDDVDSDSQLSLDKKDDFENSSDSLEESKNTFEAEVVARRQHENRNEMTLLSNNSSKKAGTVETEVNESFTDVVPTEDDRVIQRRPEPDLMERLNRLLGKSVQEIKSADNLLEQHKVMMRRADEVLGKNDAISLNAHGSDREVEGGRGFFDTALKADENEKRAKNICTASKTKSDYKQASSSDSYDEIEHEYNSSKSDPTIESDGKKCLKTNNVDDDSDNPVIDTVADGQQKSDDSGEESDNEEDEHVVPKKDLAANVAVSREELLDSYFSANSSSDWSDTDHVSLNSKTQKDRSEELQANTTDIRNEIRHQTQFDLKEKQVKSIRPSDKIRRNIRLGSSSSEKEKLKITAPSSDMNTDSPRCSATGALSDLNDGVNEPPPRQSRPSQRPSSAVQSRRPFQRPVRPLSAQTRTVQVPLKQFTLDIPLTLNRFSHRGNVMSKTLYKYEPVDNEQRLRVKFAELLDIVESDPTANLVGAPSRTGMSARIMKSPRGPRSSESETGHTQRRSRKSAMKTNVKEVDVLKLNTELNEKYKELENLICLGKDDAQSHRLMQRQLHQAVLLIQKNIPNAERHSEMEGYYYNNQAKPPSNSLSGRDEHRSRSFSPTDHNLRNSDNPMVRDWLKHKERCLRIQRSEERQRRKEEKSKHKSEAEAKDEKYRESVERVDDWMRKKRKQGRRLLRHRHNKENFVNVARPQSARPEFVMTTTSLELKRPISANHSLSRSSDHSVARSSDHSVGRSSDHSVARSSDHSVGRSSDHSVARSSDHSVGRSSDHSVGRSSDHSVAHSSDHSVAHSSDHSVARSIDHSVARSSDAAPIRPRSSHGSKVKPKTESEKIAANNEKRRISYEQWLITKRKEDEQRKKDESKRFEEIRQTNHDNDLDEIIPELARNRIRLIENNKKRVDSGFIKVDEDTTAYARPKTSCGTKGVKMYRWRPASAAVPTVTDDEQSKKYQLARPVAASEEFAPNPFRMSQTSLASQRPSSSRSRTKYAEHIWTNFSDSVWKQVNESETRPAERPEPMGQCEPPKVVERVVNATHAETVKQGTAIHGAENRMDPPKWATMTSTAGSVASRPSPAGSGAPKPPTVVSGPSTAYTQGSAATSASNVASGVTMTSTVGSGASDFTTDFTRTKPPLSVETKSLSHRVRQQTLETQVTEPNPGTPLESTKQETKVVIQSQQNARGVQQRYDLKETPKVVKFETSELNVCEDKLSEQLSSTNTVNGELILKTGVPKIVIPEKINISQLSNGCKTSDITEVSDHDNLSGKQPKRSTSPGPPPSPQPSHSAKAPPVLVTESIVSSSEDEKATCAASNNTVRRNSILKMTVNGSSDLLNDGAQTRQKKKKSVTFINSVDGTDKSSSDSDPDKVHISSFRGEFHANGSSRRDVTTGNGVENFFLTDLTDKS